MNRDDSGPTPDSAGTPSNLREWNEHSKKYQSMLWKILLVSIASHVALLIISMIWMTYLFKGLDVHQIWQQNADYLHFAMTILAAVGAFMAVFIGVDRLKALDEQVEKIERRLQDDLQQSIGLYKLEADATLDKRVGKSLKEHLFEAQKTLRTKTSQSVKTLQHTQEELLNGLENKGAQMNETLSVMEEFRRDFDWLKDRRGGRNFPPRSLADAIQMLKNLSERKNTDGRDAAENIRMVLEIALAGPESPQDAPSVSGRKEEYLELASLLADYGLPDEATQVCESAQKRFVSDPRLLAATVRYALQSGSKREASAQTAFNDLNKSLPFNKWTEECFEAAIDYYIALREPDEYDALKMCRVYQQSFPRDGRAYLKEVQVYEILYSGLEAEEKQIEVLERVLRKDISCPEGALRLSRLHADRGCFEEAIRDIESAFRFLATNETFAPYASMYLLKAQYEDGLFLKKREEGSRETALGKASMRDYQNALNCREPDGLTEREARHARLRMDLIGKLLDSQEDSP